jgi:hypothetical protein
MGGAMNRITIYVRRQSDKVKLEYSSETLFERLIEEESYQGSMLPIVEVLEEKVHETLFQELQPEARTKGNLAKHLLDVLIDPLEQENTFIPSNPVDIAIEMNYDDPLSSIPWEVVLSASVGSKTLAQLGATVTRLIRCDTPCPASLERPIKILFVSGTPIDDPAVKAGTEFYCIARSFTLRKRPFRTKLVVYATLDELVVAAKELEPHIIHFAGHGEFGAGGASILLRDPTPGKDSINVTPAQLIAALGGALPTMVILSACQTGTAQPYGASESASFAAKLVNSGVPIVAAMAGKITDLATRTFSRSLMAALVNGEPIVAVSGKARKEVFNVVDASSEWAYPGLFCANSVPLDYAIGSSESTDEEKRLQKRIDRFIETDNFEPHLCLREDAWSAYTNALNNTSYQNVLIYGEPKMGKSRILRELARQAVREGNLAIGVSTVFPTGSSPILYQRVAAALLQGLINAAYDLELGNDIDPSYLKAAGTKPMDEVKAPPGAEGEFQNIGQEMRKVAVIFEYEVRKLLAMAIAQNRLPAASKPIVFIDNVNKMPDDLISTFFESNGTVDVKGWAILGEDAIPMIATADMSETSKAQRAEFKNKGKSTFVDIGPFSNADDADIQAYERILLNPFHPEGCSILGASEVYSLTEKFFQESEENANAVKDTFRTFINGEPAKLKSPGLYVAARIARTASLMSSSTEYTMLKAVGLWEAK